MILPPTLLGSYLEIALETFLAAEHKHCVSQDLFMKTRGYPMGHTMTDPPKNELLVRLIIFALCAKIF